MFRSDEMMLPPPPGEIEPSAAAALRAAFERAGFDQSVFRVTGPIGDPGWTGVVRQAATTLSQSGRQAAGLLVRFLFLRDPMGASELEPALGADAPAVVAALERARIAEAAGDGRVRMACILLPGNGTYAMSDLIDDPAGENTPDDYILPIGESTRFVDDLAVRVPCGLAVDLGCGQGYHALRALSHARRCIATDINPRAVAFAKANAALAGASERVECRVGSFFEPLQDAKGQVGLLTCNPPYIMNPAVQTTALVNAFEGDGMMEHLVRTTPSMLAEGGWADIIGLWEHTDLADPVSRLSLWLQNSGCDALILQFRTYRPEDYYQQWMAPEVRAKGEAAWRELVDKRHIGAITFGGVILHKRTPAPGSSNWVRSFLTWIKIRSGAASSQLVGYFNTQTALAAAGSTDEFLLSSRWRLAPGWRFDPLEGVPRSVPPLAATAPAAMRGLPIPLHYAAAYESILPLFDASLTGRESLARLAAQGRISVPATDPQATAMLRAMVQAGALEIA
jgi:SAM-dependent methyltransferase